MSTSSSMRVVAVGDVMLGRGIRDVRVPRALDLLRPEVLSRLEADVVTGNLECMIGHSGEPSVTSHSHFQGSPRFAEALLRRFDVLNLANNHAGDYGDVAIQETLDWLASIGVRSVGIGTSTDAACTPVTFESGVRMAVFGATSVGALGPDSKFVLARPDKELFAQAAVHAREGYTCVLHLHGGGGDFEHPSPAMREIFRKAAEVGFDVVFGHHPHVTQGVLREPTAVQFFSLGDFVFDKCEDGRGSALIATVELNGQGAVVDHRLNFVERLPDLTLRLLEGEEHVRALSRITALSEAIRSGESDVAYTAWRGSRVKWLWRSVKGDFRAGGWPALKAKVGRMNTQKLRDLRGSR